MFHQFTSRLILKGTLEAQTAIRIGGSKSISPTEPDLPVVKDAIGRPYIPGSSFKGVLRSHIEAMMRGIFGDDPKLVCNPTNNGEWCIPNGQGDQQRPGIEKLKLDENNHRRKDSEITELIFGHTCLICQLFGSPWLASKLQIRDLPVIEELWFGQFQERSGVAIDRDKEVAAEGMLYDFEVVPAGTIFSFNAIAENTSEWQLGMLIVGLRAFETGDIAIGGGKSRGLGVARLHLTDKTYLNSQSQDALLDALINGKGYVDVDEDLIGKWKKAFHEEIQKRLKEKGESSA